MTAAPTRRGAYFGPSSPRVAAIVVFVNVVPVLTVPPLGLPALVVVGPFELVAAGLLCWEGYRSRAIGTGILIGFLTTAAVFAWLFARTYVIENIL